MFTKRFACLAVVLLGVSSVASAKSSSYGTALSAPAFLWGSQKYFQTDEGQPAQRVNYQGVSHKQLTTHLVGGLMHRDVSAQGFLNKNLKVEDSPELLLVYVGTQASAVDLRSDSMAPVASIVQGASSSLTLPYVYMDTSGEEFSASIIQYLQSELKIEKPTNVVVTGTCEAAHGADPAASLQAILGAHTEGTVDVLVVCGAAHDSDARDTLAVEVAEVAALQALLTGDIDYLAVYLVDPVPNALDVLSHSQRGLLQAVTYDQWCDADSLCMAQVKFVEAMILLIVLSVALLSGLTCSNMLDAPTRFEVATTTES